MASFGLILIASRRNYGDVQCGDTEPGILQKGVCISYTGQRQDNELRYRRILCSASIRHAAAVT